MCNDYWHSKSWPEAPRNLHVSNSSKEDSIVISCCWVPSPCYHYFIVSWRSQHGGLHMDMSSQFWHVRVWTKAWREGLTGALFPWVNKEIVGKRKAQQHCTRCWRVSPWLERGVQVYAVNEAIKADCWLYAGAAIIVSPFRGSARGAMYWISDVGDPFWLTFYPFLPCYEPQSWPWASLVGFGWDISKRQIGESRVKSGFYHSGSLYILGLMFP